jgi:RNA polymerase sigma factor (sigma-70 family)
MTDQTLLKRFAANRSEEAFRDLAAKHLGMVLGIAQRRIGNRSQAQDVAQNVFAALARKAKGLTGHASLTGWLYCSTLNECAMAHRRNHTHARKMNELSQRVLNDSDGRDIWEETLPLLDEAIDKLPKPDRELILLRFFERKSFREIGGQLGKTEAAAQKQGERALTKLSDSLRQQGVVASTAVLGAGLATNALATPPTTLISTITAEAITASASAAANLTFLETIQAMNPIHLKTAAIVTAIAAIPVASQWNANNELRADLAELQNRSAAIVEKVIIERRDSGSTAPQKHMPPNAAVRQAIPAAEPAPEKADTWRSALFEADPVLRTQRIAALLATLTPERAPHIAEMFGDLQKQGRRFSEEHRLFLRAWGRLDGFTAMAHVAPAGFKGHNSHMLAALAGWSSVQPFAAKGWIDGLEEGKSKEELIHGLLDGWSMTDFAAAAAYAETRPRSTSRNRFRKLLLERSLAAGGVHAAQQWVHAISDNEHNSDYKERALGEVIQAMLYRDPAAAAQWIS